MQTFKKYLNPLYKDLDSVASFSDITNLSTLEQEEYPRLKQVTQNKISLIKRLLPRLDKLEEELEHQIEIVQMESGEDDIKAAKSIYNQILKQINLLVDRINVELIALDSPYFGKIIFLPYDSITKKPLMLYIGKFALVDEETHIPIITDWRAPIANLYYENSGPTNNVSFIAPIGERSGDLQQKRQFQISRARIKGIYDAKSGNAAADTDVKRNTGLSYRKYLGDYDGMLFVFDKKSSTPFWMKAMEIPLDIIFIDEQSFIIDVKEAQAPCTTTYCPAIYSLESYKYVLEVNSGFCEKNNVAVGGSIILHLTSIN